MEILERQPDPAGLTHYNDRMNAGMTEAELREILLRSSEYAEKNPRGAPPPPPPPGSMMRPLRVGGNQFVTHDGPVHLQGHIICCDNDDTPENEGLARGWPLIDPATLDLMATYRLNYTHVRLGPMSETEPNEVRAYAQVADGRFDLTRWNDDYWMRFRALLVHAQSRGIYVECDLIDVWGLDHQVTPWSLHRNINGLEVGSWEVTRGRPHAVHEAWIRKVIRETAEFPNVLYQDGNESWKTSGTEWSEGVIAIAKDELEAMGLSRLVGSNNEERPGNADYYTLHQKTAPGAGTRPVMVNEYQTLPVETVLAEAKRARDLGTSFHYWAGSHSDADRLRTFAGLKTIVEGGDPPPIADRCPTLVRWGSSLHVLHIGPNLLPIPTPTQAGAIKAYGKLPNQAISVWDSTPRFGSGRGQPCNDEKGYGACGGRNCEDPRGPVFTLLEAPAGVKSKVGGNPFQFQVGPMSPGSYRLRCEPRPDCRDALGVPVKVAQDAASECRWTV
jgi:hypothetical protein